MKQTKKDTADAVEVDDVQGIVVYGYGHLPIARYVFVRFTEAAKIGAWLGEIVEQTPSAQRREKGAPRPSTAVHIALASSGLEQIGLSQEERATFSYHFVDGMANIATQRTLGDFGDNAPETWDFGGPKTPRIDALLLLFATTEEGVEALLQRHRDRMSELGIEVVTVEDGYRRDDGKEHFGFLDGVSQPHILGSGREPEAGDVALHPGELLLGYTDEYAEISATPTVPAKADPEAILAPHPDDDTQRDLGRNGSYLVYRKYQQYTSKFWGFVWDRAQPRDGEDKDAAAVMLASKMVGRWPSGAPVTLTPDRDAPELAKENAFVYKTTDAKGYGCPIGSHVRRANPRDTLDPTPEESLVETRRHRILRRGRPYGPPPSEAFSRVDDGVDRGLQFIALNADIHRQFEFIQQTWLSSTKIAGLYHEVDPIIGTLAVSGEGLRRGMLAPEDTTSYGEGDFHVKRSHFSLQAQPVRCVVADVPPFTRLRGGGYYFLPGLRAVRYLAWRASSQPRLEAPRAKPQPAAEAR
ncbi:Dyp-type peroxidase [Sorangium sp. So ce131]|uniref:Dyp-type peroxidase n=1 Tax=Sorangium sp. So ce131 TaxID=3133282 RepID=UPI003F5D6383